jgi:integrase/recombinase XerD
MDVVDLGHPEGYSVAYAAEAFVRQQQSEETRKAYGKDLRRFLAWLAADIDPLRPSLEVALAYKEHLTAVVSASSASRMFGTVRSFYTWLTRSGIVTTNPFEWVKAPQRTKDATPNVPSDDDIDRLMKAAETPQRRAIIALLLNGLRASEVTGIDFDDLTYDSGAWGVRVVGKGLRERWVPLTSETVRELSDYTPGWHGRKPVAEPIVSGIECPDRPDGRRCDEHVVRLTLRQVQHAVYKSAEDAGLRGMHPHALRHHYATRLIRAGATVLHVSKLLGHARADTTQIYVTLDRKDLVTAAALDPRSGG